MTKLTFQITYDYLYSTKLKIDHDAFIFLTGKNIDWDKRLNKFITIVRDRNYLRIYDAIFIPGMIYKSKLGRFKCDYIDDKGTLLRKEGRTLVTKYTDKTPIEELMEIA